MKSGIYRGRLAPTPSGEMHLGHIQTFYIAWKRCRHFGGKLVLRIEDLDHLRCRPQYLTQLLDDLAWIGITWDEGPGMDLDSVGPFEQSQRLDVYLDVWRALYNGGFIYPSSHSRREIVSVISISAPHEERNISAEPIFPVSLRPSPDKIPQNLSHPGNQNWRFRVPDGRVVKYSDLRCGEQSFVAGTDFGDFLVWRNDGYPSYELAVVVDDAKMQITEVVRGEDLLLSTARQILIYEALGWSHLVPQFFHCPLVRDESGVRLAKRCSPMMTVSRLRDNGWQPERILAELLPDLPSLVSELLEPTTDSFV